MHKVTTWVRQVQCRVGGSGGQACGRQDASSQKKEAERVVRTILPRGVRPHSRERRCVKLYSVRRGRHQVRCEVWGVWAETRRPGSSCRGLGGGTTPMAQSPQRCSAAGTDGAVWPVQAVRPTSRQCDKLSSGGVVVEVSVVEIVWWGVVGVVGGNPLAVVEPSSVGALVHLRDGWRASGAGGGSVVM